MSQSRRESHRCLTPSPDRSNVPPCWTAERSYLGREGGPRTWSRSKMEARAMDESAGAYLGVLDRQMEAFVGEHEWDRFLLCGLLFETRLVAPDIFFFISQRLQ